MVQIWLYFGVENVVLRGDIARLALFLAATSIADLFAHRGLDVMEGVSLRAPICSRQSSATDSTTTRDASLQEKGRRVTKTFSPIARRLSSLTMAASAIDRKAPGPSSCLAMCLEIRLSRSLLTVLSEVLPSMHPPGTGIFLPTHSILTINCFKSGRWSLLWP